MKWDYKTLLTIFLVGHNWIMIEGNVTYKCKDLGDECKFSNITASKDTGDVYFQGGNQKSIVFENCKIYSFDSKAFVSYPYKVVMSGCGIEILNVTTDKRQLDETSNINLSNNLIESIPAAAFKELSELVSLDVSNNRISSIGLQAFPTSLTYIYLSSNSITKIQNGTFQGEDSRLELIDLSNNLIEVIEENSFPEMRHGKILLRNNSLTFVTSEMFSSCNNLETLDLSMNKISTIPSGAFQFLYSMKNLSLNGNSLTTVESYGLEIKIYSRSHGSEVEYFLNNNNLSILRDYMFANCWNATHLDLSNNQITSIEGKAFENSVNLKKINLAHNKLTIVKSGTFSYLQLQTLILDDNTIKIIERQSLGSSIHELGLERNPLEMIEDSGRVENLNLFDKKKLKIVNLSYVDAVSVHCQSNSIEQLTIGPNNHFINASNNHLRSVRLFNGSSIISRLDVSNNTIADISDIIEMENLVYLDLSFNPIGPLNFTTLAKLKNLQNLNLEATNLSYLEFGMFAQQTELISLDISYNHLATIDLEIFTASNKLYKLHLDGNELSSIGYVNIDTLFPRLKYVGLYGNNWTCWYLIGIIRYFNGKRIAISSDKASSAVSNVSNIAGIFCSTRAFETASTEVVTQKSTESFAEASTEAFTGAFTESFAKSSARAFTVAFTDASTESFAESSTEASTESLAKSSTESFAKSSARAFTEAFTDASTELFAKSSAEAFTESSTEASTEAFTESSTEASTTLQEKSTMYDGVLLMRHELKEMRKRFLEYEDEAFSKSLAQDNSTLLYAIILTLVAFIFFI